MPHSLFSIWHLFSVDENDKPLPDGPVGFEDAIKATKFGKFNLMMMAFSFLGALAFIFDTTIIPFTIPNAECDLQISLLDKGVLNAMAHSGMICSAPLVGFLADTLGRQKILFWGLFFDAICNIFATFSHSFILTAVLKFTAGFFVGGTNIVLVSMMAEFHTSKLRPTIVMFIGLGFSTAMLVVPVLALIILPDAYNIPLGSYNFHSWQILMAVGSIPATLGAILAFFIPESPRFLMSRDRMPEALAVLRKVYSINTGLAPDTYPVKELKSIHVKESETVTADNGDILKDADIQDLGEVKKENSMTAIRGGLNQMKPLFLPPHVYNILIMFAVHFSAVAGCNSLRLWLPQLFKMMSEYSSEGTLCEMISLKNTTIVEVPQPEDGVCEPIQVNSQTYINSIIVASVQVGLMTIASLFINKIGKRRLLTTAFACGGLCSLSLYFCTSTTQATALASVNVAFTMMCSNTVSSILVDLFPTSLRAMAMALVMMMGRIGSITGSVIFPALLALGCLPPFLSIACLLFFGGLMTLMIPRGTTT